MFWMLHSPYLIWSDLDSDDDDRFMIAIKFHESAFHVHFNSVLVLIYRVTMNLHNKFLIRNRQPWTGNWNNGSVSRIQYSLSDIHLNFSTSICIPRYYVTHGIFWLHTTLWVYWHLCFYCIYHWMGITNSLNSVHSLTGSNTVSSLIDVSW